MGNELQQNVVGGRLRNPESGILSVSQRCAKALAGRNHSTRVLQECQHLPGRSRSNNNDRIVRLRSFMVPSVLELRDGVTLRPVDAFHVRGVVPARANAGVQEIRWRSSLERRS